MEVCTGFVAIMVMIVVHTFLVAWVSGTNIAQSESDRHKKEPDMFEHVKRRGNDDRDANEPEKRPESDASRRNAEEEKRRNGAIVKPDDERHEKLQWDRKKLATKEFSISSTNSAGAKNATRELARKMTPSPKRIKTSYVKKFLIFFISPN